MLKFALYASNHGYGHATRMRALAAELIKWGVYVHVRTACAEIIFASLDKAYCEISKSISDFGVLHGPNLSVNKQRTKDALIDLMSRRLDIVESETNFLRNNQVDLVVVDVPWLPIEAATYAGVPVFAISNFDWLYIYNHVFSGDRAMLPILNVIAGLYQRVDLAYRLPMSKRSSMSAFQNVRKVGLLASTKNEYVDIRQRHHLDGETKIAYCAVGGAHPLDLDLKNFCKAFPGVVITPNAVTSASNNVVMDPEVDSLEYVHGADVVLAKPGYGILSECLQFGKRVICVNRMEYPEDRILVEGMDRFGGCDQVEMRALTAKEWRRAITSALETTLPVNKMRNESSHIAKTIIGDLINHKYRNSKLTSVFDLGSNNINYALCVENSPRPIHAAQIETRLAEKTQLLPDGKISVPSTKIREFKLRFAHLYGLDRAIQSGKHVIATGIHRQLHQNLELKDWFNKKYSLKYRVIVERQESELVYYAAKHMLTRAGKNVIVDIGGFTTEICCASQSGIVWSLSLPLGVLRFPQKTSLKDEISRIMADKLNLKDMDEIETMICIGLIPVGIAEMVSGVQHSTRKIDHEITITQKELRRLIQRLGLRSTKSIADHHLTDKQIGYYRISTLLTIELLEYFGLARFKVCPNGISVGLHNKLNLGKKTELK